jgi:formylglycine-generating enzyme required for sulfatase activity
LQREIKQALEQAEEKLEHDVYLIPARLDDCEVPDALSEIQWVDLFEHDGWRLLLNAIEYGLKQRGKTTPTPASSAALIETTSPSIENSSSVITHEPFTDDLNGAPLEMIFIPGAVFKMGSPVGIGYDNEWPQRNVTAPDFYIGKYQVTQAQWGAVMGADPSYFKGDPALPVENISGNDAKKFCEKLSKMAGKAYRLPSEAEWEYAARAGTITPFAFGPTITAEVANCFQQDILTVGKLGVANGFGLFDMHGNIIEWCQDDLRNDLQGWPADGEFLKKGDRRFRPLRGGSCLSTGMEFGIGFCRSAMRFRARAETRRPRFGLRVMTYKPPI